MEEDFPNEEAFWIARLAWQAEHVEFCVTKATGTMIARKHGSGFATPMVITGPLAGAMWWGRAVAGRPAQR